MLSPINSKPVFNTKRWIEIALINFCIVALAGFTMRYKINFALPEVNQRYLMHAHSNFAFIGWVAIALMTLMIRYLIRNNLQTNYRKYNWILIVDVISAYGVFTAFYIQGYELWSNVFSLITIVTSYFFIYYYWKDLNKIHDKNFSVAWLRAALILWGFSSLGEIGLSYLMVRNILIQDLYFMAFYFFLHFQYNGWFLFVCFGIFFSYMHRQGLHIEGLSKKLFIVLSVLVVPSYTLSIFWLNTGSILHQIANISGILQIFVLYYFVKILIIVIRAKNVKFHKSTSWIWLSVSVAFLLKITLMMLSIAPSLSHLAFGFRPVIIGYLHLSFIGVTSLFILGYINEFIHRFRGRLSGLGALVFIAGFAIQEIMLMLQGLEALNVRRIKSANIILFYCATLMVLGLIWITYGIMKTRDLEYDQRATLPEK